MTETNKPNTMYWIIGVIALIWNAWGVFAYLGNVLMTDDLLAILPAEQQEMIANQPSWYTAAFAIAVWFGLLGSISLLIKKKWAYPLFLISLLGILGSTVYNMFMSGGYEFYGAQAYIMPLMVLLIGIYLVMHAKKSIAKGWLS
jgi:hypothetical protein